MDIIRFIGGSNGIQSQLVIENIVRGQTLNFPQQNRHQEQV